MRRRHILIADDDRTKREQMTEVARSASPHAILHVAASAREAMAMIDTLGETIDTGLIDYDYQGERHTGADVVGSLRRASRSAHITCATARPEGSTFEEAAAYTLAAGANGAICAAREDFEAQLRMCV